MSAAPSATAPDGLVADLVVRAATVLTMGSTELEGPAAVIVRDGLVAGVVPAAEATRYIGPATRVLDAGERTIMPGFVDPHAHVEVASRVASETVDCRAPGRASIDDVCDTLREALPDARDGWIVGQANLFFDQKLRERRLPSREDLDRVSRNTAIAIRAGGHLTVLNSKALELAGITRDHEVVDHSITGKPTVHRSDDGEPTGVVAEMDNLVPWPTLDEGERAAAMTRGIADLFTSRGVTTIGEISETVTGLHAYDDAVRSGRLNSRILVYLWTPGTVSLDQACAHEELLPLEASPDRLRVHGVKMFADGGYSARKAALIEPYLDRAYGRGELALTQPQVATALRRTREAGLQLAIHANGDRAQLEVCEALIAVRDAPGRAPRTRVEHAGNLMPDYHQLTSAWAAADIIPVPQPVFIHNFSEFIPGYVGDYATERQFPFRRLIDDGWALSGSSDVWVGSESCQTEPFFSIRTCVQRRTFHGHELSPEQAISIAEALWMHTVGGATALGVQDTRGSLEAGRYADFLILDANPMHVHPDDLDRIQVDEVFVAGQSVHARRSAPPLTTPHHLA
ncbi:amidohydrolase family protein [Nocardioides sp. IC4_145]|uniref:amidohydrolase n=1 Tax=Nocardioides sp. IC4_145 TaxID=2714037 RepID=UPI001409C884|nr:amidohydrolase family protein [Nocardioides sp. IC4_145]NHC24323.1 amidohydrolase family protein [Nocardioides sp. IC4_145]